MTAHTPGPWLTSGEPDRGIVVYAENDTTGADLCHVKDGDNTAANARLIAAAPELLAACKWAAKSEHHRACKCRGGHPEQYCTCHVLAARAAIARATGEAR